MAIDRSGKTLRGLLIQDPNLTSATYSSTLSTVTQAGPIPGVPDAQGDTEMVLEATGDQLAGSRYDIIGVNGGMPVPDGGTFGWRDATTDLWRVWDPPQTIAASEFLDWTSTANRWKHPHAITLPSGKIVAVAMKARQYVTCWVRAVGGTWTNADVSDNGTTYTHAARPCLVLLPSGRILCFWWFEDVTNSLNQVRMKYSDDDGATWTIGQRACLIDSLDTATYTPGRLRAAYLGGQILLVASVVNAALAYDDIFVQYASADSGTTFTKVSTWLGADKESHGSYHDILVVNGQFQFYFLRYATSTTATIIPCVKTIGNAFTVLASTASVIACETTNPMEWGLLVAAAFTDGDLAVWADDAGCLWMAGRDHAAGAKRGCYTARSKDGGTTWTSIGHSPAPGFGAAWWQGQDVQTYPTDLCGVAQGARAVILHTFAANPETHDPSLTATYLGGWTTVGLPPYYAAIVPTAMTAWERTWLPFDLPEDTGAIYTASTVGAPVVTMTADGIDIAAGAGEYRRYLLATNPTSTLAQGLITLWDVRVIAGTGVISVKIANATPVSYIGQVYVTPTSITLRDGTAGAAIGSATTTTAGATGVQLLIAVGNADAGLGATGKVYAWWRAATTGTGTDREWAPIGSIGYSTTLTAGASAGNDILWGNLGTAADHIRSRLHCYTYGAYAGQQLYAGQENPGGALGHAMGTGTGVWIDQGLRLTAKAGPILANDQWQIPCGYRFPISNIFPDKAPSPSTYWRSLTDGVTADIVVVYDETAAEENAMRGPVLGIHLNGINFKTAYLDGWDIGTANWIAVATIDASSDGTSLKYVREGKVTRPDEGVGTAGNTYYTANILKGSSFWLGGTVVRKIAGNAEGAWTNLITKRPRLTLEGIINTEPTSGTGELWSRDVTVMAFADAKFSRYRLRIPNQSTAEGYFRVGAMVLGHVAVFGQDYSNGRSLTTTPNTEITTLRDGRRRSRVLGTPRRSVRFGWSETVDTTILATATPQPDYVLPFTPGSSQPVATPADTLHLVTGLLEEGNGSDRLVVVLPSIKISNGVQVTVTNRHLQLYGRITGVVKMDQVHGNEWSSEVHKGTEITIEEEL